MSLRQERVNSLLKNIASQFFGLKTGTDAIISVTRTEISPDLKNAKIFISIFPKNKEKDLLNILRKKKHDLRKYAKSKLKMKFLPLFEIEIDGNEKNRQRIDELLKII